MNALVGPASNGGGGLCVGPTSATTGSMTGVNMELTARVESYFVDLGRVRASSGAIEERSSYGRLAIVWLKRRCR